MAEEQKPSWEKQQKEALGKQLETLGLTPEQKKNLDFVRVKEGEDLFKVTGLPEGMEAQFSRRQDSKLAASVFVKINDDKGKTHYGMYSSREGFKAVSADSYTRGQDKLDTTDSFFSGGDKSKAKARVRQLSPTTTVEQATTPPPPAPTSLRELLRHPAAIWKDRAQKTGVGSDLDKKLASVKSGSTDTKPKRDGEPTLAQRRGDIWKSIVNLAVDAPSLLSAGTDDKEPFVEAIRDIGSKIGGYDRALRAKNAKKRNDATQARTQAQQEAQDARYRAQASIAFERLEKAVSGTKLFSGSKLFTKDQDSATGYAVLGGMMDPDKTPARVWSWYTAGLGRTKEAKERRNEVMHNPHYQAVLQKNLDRGWGSGVAAKRNTAVQYALAMAPAGEYPSFRDVTASKAYQMMKPRRNPVGALVFGLGDNLAARRAYAYQREAQRLYEKRAQKIEDKYDVGKAQNRADSRSSALDANKKFVEANKFNVLARLNRVQLSARNEVAQRNVNFLKNNKEAAAARKATEHIQAINQGNWLGYKKMNFPSAQAVQRANDAKRVLAGEKSKNQER